MLSLETRHQIPAVDESATGLAIDVRNMHLTYPKAGTPALRDVSFGVRRGEIFGLLGPSGAGKSTMQKILIGLLQGYRGSAMVLGRDVAEWGSDYYEHIGVSFELPNHYLKLTAIENLRHFRALYHGSTETPEAVLEQVGLAEDGDKRVGQFSKGMRTRLNLARALLHRPEILFLDEPTTGLDPVNARRITDLIRQKREEGTSIFLTTHNMTMAETICDRVGFIVDGELLLVDSPRELKLRYGQRQVRVEFEQGSHSDTVEFPLDRLGENPAFLDLLRHARIETIHTQETTLDQIFIGVTGRELS